MAEGVFAPGDVAGMPLSPAGLSELLAGLGSEDDDDSWSSKAAVGFGSSSGVAASDGPQPTPLDPPRHPSLPPAPGMAGALAGRLCSPLPSELPLLERVRRAMDTAGTYLAADGKALTSFVDCGAQLQGSLFAFSAPSWSLPREQSSGAEQSTGPARRGRKPKPRVGDLQTKLDNLTTHFGQLKHENACLKQRLQGLEQLVPRRNDCVEFLASLQSSSTGQQGGAQGPQGPPQPTALGSSTVVPALPGASNGCPTGPSHAWGCSSGPSPGPSPSPGPGPGVLEASAVGLGVGSTREGWPPGPVEVAEAWHFRASRCSGVGGSSMPLPAPQAWARQPCPGWGPAAGASCGGGQAGPCAGPAGQVTGADACAGRELRAVSGGTGAGSGTGSGTGGWPSRLDSWGPGGARPAALALCPTPEGEAPVVDAAAAELLRRTTAEELRVLWRHVCLQLSSMVLSAEVQGAGSPQRARLERFLSKVCSYIDKLLVLAPASFFHNLYVNMDTGEREVPGQDFWANLGRAANLDPGQLDELQSIAALHEHTLAPVMQERRQLALELSARVAALRRSTAAFSAQEQQARDLVYALLERLQRNVLHEKRACRDTSHLVCYNVLTQLQLAKLLAAAYPLMPDFVAIMHGLITHSTLQRGAQHGAERA